MLEELVKLVSEQSEKSIRIFDLSEKSLHLTAREAKMVLLTRADLKSVRAPGEWSRGS